VVIDTQDTVEDIHKVIKEIAHENDYNFSSVTLEAMTIEAKGTVVRATISQQEISRHVTINLISVPAFDPAERVHQNQVISILEQGLLLRLAYTTNWVPTGN